MTRKRKGIKSRTNKATSSRGHRKQSKSSSMKMAKEKRKERPTRAVKLRIQGRLYTNRRGRQGGDTDGTPRNFLFQKTFSQGNLGKERKSGKNNRASRSLEGKNRSKRKEGRVGAPKN